MEKEIIGKITDKVLNMIINSLLYDLEGLEKNKVELQVKLCLGRITPQEQIELKAIETIFEHHEKGGRISELRKA